MSSSSEGEVASAVPAVIRVFTENARAMQKPDFPDFLSFWHRLGIDLPPSRSGAAVPKRVDCGEQDAKTCPRKARRRGRDRAQPARAGGACAADRSPLASCSRSAKRPMNGRSMPTRSTWGANATQVLGIRDVVADRKRARLRQPARSRQCADALRRRDEFEGGRRRQGRPLSGRILPARRRRAPKNIGSRIPGAGSPAPMASPRAPMA